MPRHRPTIRSFAAGLATAAVLARSRPWPTAWDIIVPPSMPDSDGAQGGDLGLLPAWPGARREPCALRRHGRTRDPPDRHPERPALRRGAGQDKDLRPRDGTPLARDRRALRPGQPGHSLQDRLSRPRLRVRAEPDGRREPAPRRHVGDAPVRSRTQLQRPARRLRALPADRRAYRGAAVGKPLRHDGAQRRRSTASSCTSACNPTRIR